MQFDRLFTSRTASSTIVALCLLTGAARPTLAGAVTTLAALGANDTVDFSVFAPNTIFTNAFFVHSSGGIGVQTTEPSSAFASLRQAPVGSWVGNFPSGTAIIYDQGPSGPVTFSFSAPIQGFGLTIDDAFGGGYTGAITEFNGTTVLGTFTSSSPQPATMFLGVLDATADITSITIGTTAVGNNSFAFANLSLVDAASIPLVTSVPEPASIGFVLAGLASLAAAYRKR